MNKTARQLLWLSDMKAKGREALRNAIEDRQSRDEIYATIARVMASYPKEGQLHNRRELRAHLEGYLKAVEDLHANFLYLHNGTYYSTHESARTGFTPWDQLPHELWGDLDNMGGVYWTFPGESPIPYDVAE